MQKRSQKLYFTLRFEKKVFKIFLFAECLSRIVGQKRTEKEKKKTFANFSDGFSSRKV